MKSAQRQDSQTLLQWRIFIGEKDKFHIVLALSWFWSKKSKVETAVPKCWMRIQMIWIDIKRCSLIIFNIFIRVTKTNSNFEISDLYKLNEKKTFKTQHLKKEGVFDKFDCGDRKKEQSGQQPKEALIGFGRTIQFFWINKKGNRIRPRHTRFLSNVNS